jgi:integrase
MSSDSAENPVRETRNPRRRNVVQTAAYDLATIQAILNSLPLKTRAACAVAAFAGLRRGEIFGLQWQDWKDGILHVNRQVAFDEKGRMIVQEPKTMASKDAVPVIPALAEILQEWKNAAKHSQGCWIFPADFVRGGEHTLMLKDVLGRTPLSPANLVRDQVEPILEKANISWRGFHAFRRGLATNSMHSAFRTLTSNRFSGIRMSRSLVPAISKDSRRRHRLQWEYSEPHGQNSGKKRRGKRDREASKTGKSPDFHRSR